MEQLNKSEKIRGFLMLFTKKILPVIVWILGLTVFAQTRLEKEAETIYRNFNYQEAMPKYEYLVKRYPKNGKFHHRYAVCLIETGTDYVEARKHLKISRSQGIRVSDMYAGKAYYMEYQFDKAIELYTKYLKSIHPTSENYEWTKAAIKKSQEMLNYLNRTEDVQFLSYQVVDKKDFFKHYKISDESGKIISTSEFEQDTDSAFAMYINERGDRVCYPRILNDTLDTDLFEKSKLLNKWGGEERLGGEINSEGNELYPYILDDGVTLYFSSNGHGGLGGYDIFVSRYNSETRTFMPPTNLGMPYNSIGDDFLFVKDEFANVGWFASDRNNKDGKITLYSFKPNEYRKTLEAEREELIKAARLLLNGDSLVSVGVDEIGNSNMVTEVVNEDKPIFFVLNDTIIYRSTSQFVSAAALSLYRAGESKINRLDAIKENLAAQREQYARAQTEDERNAISTSIMKLEEELFEIDGQSEDPYFKARMKELEVLEASNWKLYRATDYDKLLSESDKTEKITQPVFNSERLQNNAMLVFTNDEYLKLINLDKTLKSTQENLEQLNEAGLWFLSEGMLESTTTYFWRELRKIDSTYTYTKSMNELKQINDKNKVRLTRRWLDIKREKLKVIENRAHFYALRLEGVEPKMQMMELLEKGNEMLLEVNHSLDSVPIQDLNLSLLEAQKKIATNSQEKFEESLTVYINSGGVLDPNPIAKLTKDEQSDSIPPTPEPDFETGLVYKVQIGIFSAQPAQNLLNKIPPTETMLVDGLKYPKYFAGKYRSLQEAKQKAKEFDKIGFKGAFVVPFIDGKVVDWKQANTYQTTK